MTRLSDDAWRARMEGKKTVREAAPLPLFDGTAAAPPPKTSPPTPQPEPPPPLPSGTESAPAPAPRPPIVAIVCSRGRGGGCRRVELPNDEASDPWARARAGKAPTPVERGTAGSEAAGSKWTKAEKQAIDSAIGILAAAEIPFTSDEVWALAPGVPVSKGIGARLRLAARRGLIRNTGEHRTSTRGGKHDHAQTLTVWIGGNP